MDSRTYAISITGILDPCNCRQIIRMLKLCGNPHRSRQIVRTDKRCINAWNRENLVNLSHGLNMLNLHTDQRFLIRPSHIGIKTKTVLMTTPKTHAPLALRRILDRPYQQLGLTPCFDQWCDLRDAESKAAIVTDAVSPRIAGTPDLQRYGNWLDSPEYGQVWRPRVASSWTPYYDGEWAWREPYGYTWVSYEPWGWVPYHYGRWVHIKRYNWCWVPWETRHVVYRPRWHPALVSFTYANHGRHFSYSLGGGYYSNPCVGWFPLGPRDPFIPWYSLNWTYVDRYTHRYHHIPGAHITNITINTGHTYQNQHLANAITVVPLRDFQSGNYRTKAPVTLAPANRPVVSVGHEALPQLSNRRTIVAKPQRDHVEMTYTNPASSKVSTTKQTPETIKKEERDSSTSPVRLSGPRRSLPSAAPSRNTANTATQIQQSTSRNAPSPALSNQNRTTSMPRSEVRTAPQTGSTPLRNSVQPSPARTNPRAAEQPGSNVITYPRASSQIRSQSPAPARETKITPSAPAPVQPGRTSKPRVEERESAQARPSIPRTNQERQIIINAAQARQTNSLRATEPRETAVSSSRTTTPPARITTQDIRTTSQYKPQPGIYSTQPQRSSPQRQVSPSQSFQNNQNLSRMRTPNYSTTGRTTYSNPISQPRASSAPSPRISTSPSRTTSIGSSSPSTLSSPSTSSRSSSSYSPARSTSPSQYGSSGYSPSRSSSPSYSSPRGTGTSNSRVPGSTSRPR